MTIHVHTDLDDFPFRYGCNHRPPGYGTIPNKPYRTAANPTFNFGEVRYAMALTADERHDFELDLIPVFPLPKRGDLFASLSDGGGGSTDIYVVLSATDRIIEYARVECLDASHRDLWEEFCATSFTEFVTPEALPSV